MMATHPSGASVARRLRICWPLLLGLATCVNSSSYSAIDFNGSEFYLSTASVVADGQSSAVVGLAVKKADGSPLPGLTVTFAAADCNVVQPTAPTNSLGLVRGSISSSRAGARTVSATITWADLNTTLNKTVSLGFLSAQPQAGTPADANQDLSLTVLDANGALQADYTGTVHFTSTDPLAVLPADYTYMLADAGEHVFAGSVVLRTAGVQTVDATDVATQRIVAQQTFNVAPQNASHLEVTGPPANWTAGTPVTLHATLRDRWNNIASLYTGTLQLATSDLRAQVPSAHTFTSQDAGVFDFNALTLVTAGLQAVSIFDASNNDLRWTPQSYSVAGATAAALQVVTPSLVSAGIPAAISVAVRDTFGNLAGGFSGTLHFATSDPRAGAPPDWVLTAADMPEQTLAAGLTWRSLGNQNITVTADGQVPLAALVQNVVVQPGALDHFAVAVAGGNAVAGAYAQVRVTAYDTAGNIATSYRGTARLTATDSQVSVQAAHAFSAADNGTYEVSAIFRSAGNQTLTVADSTTPTAAGHAIVAVSPAALAALGVTMTPNTLVAGADGNLTVRAIDRFGNPVNQLAGQVTFAISDPLATPLAPYTFVDADHGTHVFTYTQLRTAGNQNISVSAPGVVGNTGPIAVIAAAPTALHFATQPGAMQTVCTAIMPAPRVLALDAYGNIAVASDRVNVGLVGGGTSTWLGGTSAQSYDANRVATFSGLHVNTPGATYTLMASPTDPNATLSSVSSQAFSVVDSAPQIVLNTASGSGGCIGLTYTLTSACPVDLALAVDLQNSNAYVPLTQQGQSPNSLGVSQLPASPAGMSGLFAWDSTQDAPRTQAPSANLRVTATTATQSTHATLSGVSVSNALAMQATGVGSGIFVVDAAAADLNRDGRMDGVGIAGFSVVSFIGGLPAGTFASGLLSTTTFLPTHVATADFNRDAIVDVVVMDASGHASWLAGDGNGHFGAETAMAVPSGVVAMATADIDQDAWSDIVVAWGPGQHVGYLKHHNDGTFAPAAGQVIGSAPSVLHIADVNRDSYPDVLVAGASAVYILHGAPSGLAAPLTLAGSTGASAVTALDLDADGHLDIVAAAGATLLAFLADGAGGFQAPMSVSAASAFSQLYAADLDFDGKADVLGIGGTSIAAYLGDGTGALHNALTQTASNSLSGAAFADFTRDGWPDLFVTDAAGQQTLWANTTAHPCTWRVGDIYATGLPFDISEQVVADFTEDGKPDVLVVSETARVSALLVNDGTGNMLQSGTWATGAAPKRPASADFDGDGHADVALVNTADGTMMTFLGDGRGSFAISAQQPGASVAPTAVAVGRFYEDGKSHLAVAGGAAGGVQLMRNLGDATFVPTTWIHTAANPVDLAEADVDGNGHADLLVLHSGTLVVAKGHGDGTFTTTHFTVCNSPNRVVPGFLDADGNIDIITVCSDGSVNALLGAGDGTFQATVTYHPQGVNGVAVADITGDGFTDVVTSGDGRLTVAAGDGTGHFTAANYAIITQGTAVAPVDLNGDGALDIVTGHPQFAVMSINDGAGHFAVPAAMTLSRASATPLQTADVNGDGADDIVFVDNQDDGGDPPRQLQVLLGRGTGNFNAALYFDTGPNPSQVALGDVNHDGAVDAVVTASYGGASSPNTYIFFSTPTPTLWTPSQYALGNNATNEGLTVIAIGDMNGDGNQDLVFDWADNIEQIHIALGDGAGRFIVKQDLFFYPGSLAVLKVELRDYNRDGALDAATDGYGSPDNLSVQLNDGNGNDLVRNGLQQNPTFRTSLNSAGQTVFEDFDRDGMIDVISNAGTCPFGKCNFFVQQKGNPNGSFTVLRGISAPAQPCSEVAADINRDGAPDLVTVQCVSSALGVHINDGTGNFLPVRYFVGDGEAGWLNARDFDHDGAIDVIHQFETSNFVAHGLVVRHGR